MAAKNWRENREASPPKTPEKRAPATTANDGVRLGPIVRTFALVLIAVALGWLVYVLIVNVQPNKKTALYLINTTKSDFIADSLAGGLFADESSNQVREKNDNLQLVESGEEQKGNSFGPQKNVALFYLPGDLSTDLNDQLIISRNDLTGGNRFEARGGIWRSFREQLDDIRKKGKTGIHRVVLLDLGQTDEPLRLSDSSVNDRITKILEEMGDPTDLWIFISAGGSQRSWYSPELGTSVFSFYLTQGLAGWANPGATEISLKDLVEYVEVSVSRWARDYRFSTQSPQLISANPLDKADGISVIFGNKKPDSVTGSFREYKTTELDPLWENLARKKRSHSQFPHLLAMIESRLVRLEEVRYCSTAEHNRSLKIFDKLKTEVEQLLERLPGLTRYDSQAVSLEQIELAGFSPNTSLAALNDYLYPKPKGPSGGGEPTGEQKDNQADPQNSKPQAEASAKPQEPPEALKNLSKVQRLKLVWQYASRDNAASPPLKPAVFEKCVDFVVAGSGNRDNPVLEGQPVDLLELRFLKILKDNINWTDKFSAQIKGLQAAIQCRQLSESLIQGSFLGPDFKSLADVHAQAWPRVRESFLRLEAQRRSAEDRLLANQLEEAVGEFTKLKSEYESLTSQMDARISLRQRAIEVLEISPHLRTFLVNEATLCESNDEIKTQLGKLNDLQGLAIRTLEGLQTGPLDAGVNRENLSQLTSALQTLREFFNRNYQQPLLDSKKTESNVVFDGLNILASPIPEWLAGETKSQRPAIRTNVDSWIKKQRTTITDDERWKQKPDASEIPLERKTMKAAEYRRLVLDAPKYEFKKLADYKLTTPLAVGEHIALFTKGNKQFQDNFAYKKQPLSGINDLLAWHSRLAELDFELRVQTPVLSIAAQSLDVGPQLQAFDRLILDNDKLDRAFMDFWGDGNVLSVAGQPSYTRYSQLYQEEFVAKLAKLAQFKSGLGEKEPAFVVDGIRQSLTQKIDDAKQVWIRWQASKLTWPEKPTEYFRDNTLEIKTTLETEFQPRDILVSDALTMGSKIFVDGQPLDATTAFDFSGSPSSIPAANFQPNQKSNTIKTRATVSFRGHSLAEEFAVREGIIREPVRVVYKTEHRKQIPGESKIQIKNSGNYKADIVFILDCSKSMEEPVSGRFIEAGEITQSTRFKFSKEALKTAARELSDENRFRFGLYAFGHRGEFGTYDNATGKYRVSDHHPFDDCEALVHLSDHGSDVTTKSDVDVLLGKIDPLKCKGITPLYYSIHEAAVNEYFGTDYSRPRYIVVLTDGENTQINTPDEPSASLPDGKSVKDATSKVDVRDIIAKNQIRLFVARISKSGSDTDRELADAGATVLSVLESDSAKISDAILDAIGRNEYSLTAKDSNEPARKKQISRENITSTNQTGPFVVETFGVERPSQFEVSLEGDETLFFENRPDGLVLDNPNPNFLPDSEGANGRVSVSLGSGNYDVGRLKPDSDRELWFGFLKTNVVANSPSKNFSFRPQRIWAQVTDRHSKIQTGLFLPIYSTGSFPVARFDLPPAMLNTDSVEICLWVVPHRRDTNPAGNGGAVQQSLGQPIDRNVTTLEGIKCERTETGQTTNIKISCPDHRLYFVNCPRFDSFTRTTRFADGVQTNDDFEFEVDQLNANFSLSVLPLQEFDAIMNRVDSSTERTGSEKDPIFGDDAVWIKFENVKIKK